MALVPATQRETGDAASACPSVVFTHGLRCSIIADLWRRGDSTRTSEAANCSALRFTLHLAMRLDGGPWHQCCQCPELIVFNLWRRARYRARGNIVLSGSVRARACRTFRVLANAPCARHTLPTYCVACESAVRSMEKLGQFAASLQHSRSAPVRRQICEKLACLATEAGWIHSETGRAHSAPGNGFGRCYCAACTRAVIDMHEHEYGHR